MATDMKQTDGRVKGGLARAKALSPEERTEIAKKAAQARWEKDLPQATHEGILHIGKIEIPCAVLADGQRLLTLGGLMQALGRARQAKGRQYYRGDDGLPVFMAAQNLRPFISKDLLLASEYIEFKPKGVPRAFGFRAEILPKLCDMFLDAEEAGALTQQQKHIAVRAKMLMRGLAHVGVIALVDEATGYQEIRDRLALQEILDRYLRKEFAAWAKRFPDEFYKEIFRLRRWMWKEESAHRPGVVAHYTNDVVYARLAPGILKTLEERNPKLDSGRRKGRHHQLFTDDVGHPALAQHLYAVTGLMRIAETWDEFMSLLNRAYPKKDDSVQLALSLAEA
jgi:hypothetical protein